ncbi:hypothetical protein [Streptomyces sp. NPDC003032]
MNPALTRAVTLSAGLLLCAAPLTVANALASDDPDSRRQAAQRPTLTAKATVKSAKAWHQFRVQGASKRLPAGTPVTLQQLQHKRWVSLPIRMNTNRNHTYNVRVKLGFTGPNKIRIVGGGAVSKPVDVTIR